MPAPETARLFFALWPDETTRAALQQLQVGLHGRLIRPADLHITLAFLGQQPTANVPLLKTLLADLPQTELVLQLDRIGYFKRKRIAWAGMHAVPEALTKLQAALTQALEHVGIPFDQQTHFKPHITLARDADLPPDSPFDVINWKATQAVLVQSGKHSESSAYRVLASRWLREPT